MQEKKSLLLNKEIVLLDWDWPNNKGPKCLEAIIINDYNNGKYEILLVKPLNLPDSSLHHKLIIEGRHKGYPLTKIIPSFFKKIFIFRHPLSRMVSPFVAVNVLTENGYFFSVASVYLKSVYLKARGSD